MTTEHVRARTAGATFVAGAAAILCAAFSTLHAQGTGSAPSSVRATRTMITISPAIQSWSFGKDVPLDSIAVSGVRQISAPFAVQVPLGTRWMGSVTGAIASTSLTARDANGDISRSMSGPTDLRVRASGPLLGDALSFTVGVNLPTGAVNLTPAENDVIRVSAAPALDAQVPIAGLGFGATAGLVYARNVGIWAVALGASVEKRGTYSPLDAQIAGVGSRTDLEPGGATHLSLGIDGLVGSTRLLVGIVTDLYGRDLLRQSVASATPIDQYYQLGPTVAVGAALEFRSSALRDLTLRVNERYRAGFRDENDQQVDGSSGNYFDVGLSGLRGAPGTRSLLLGVNASQHSGLPVDQGLIGAGLTAAGATVGVVQPAGAFEYTARVSASVGSLKTSLVTSGITAFTLGLTVRRQ